MDDLQPGVRCEVRYGATPDFRAATITASDGTRLGVTYAAVSTKTGRVMDKGRVAGRNRLSRLFDKEKTLREGSCLIELRAVPFRDVLLAC